MKTLIPISFLFLVIACAEPREIKSSTWKNNQISWKVLDAGATTSFLWKIYFNSDLIFESYSTPYIVDISTKDDFLIIHCLVSRDSVDYIKIDLNKVEEFVDDPVSYERDVLKESNSAYVEPYFIERMRVLYPEE